MKHVILGNGAAAITAAEKLRELKAEDEIIVVSKEDTPVYSKCMLPDYVGGKMTKEKIFIRTEEGYTKKQVNLKLNCCVENIDVDKKRVFFQNGSSENYDRLLIAIGGTPFIPPIEGLHTAEYDSINSVKDADNIIDKAEQGGKAVIMGAGLTGIEMAFALARRGMHVTVVEREPKMLPLQLDIDSSQIMATYLEKEGIRVMTGTTVCEVGSKGRKCVKLSDGQLLNYDMLLIAVGTRPNLDLIKNTGIKYSRGILVDEYLKSSVEDVYAAGDVAEAINPVSNEYVTSYIWPNAMAQGRCAAYNMAGVCQTFSCGSVMQNMVQMRDMRFVSMGLVNPKGSEYEVWVQKDMEHGIYKKIVLKDNKLKGMILIGDTQSANNLSSMIRKETDILGNKEELFA